MPGTKYSRGPAPKVEAMGDTGSTHVRYSHGNMPSVLHVRCPRCSGLAIAGPCPETPARLRKIVFAERELPVTVWDLRCTQCVHRVTTVQYEDLPRLFWRAEAAGVEIWAWNREHLQMLRKVLAKESVDGDPYEGFATYARKEWLIERNRKRLLNAVTKVLEPHAT